MKIFLILISVFILQACYTNEPEHNTASLEIFNEAVTSPANIKKIINPEGKNLLTRIFAPAGYQRIELKENSFEDYLRNLPLKPHGSEVKYYTGQHKENRNIYDAVVDLAIGNKDLHQCADAIMRLRAEYLWNLQQYDKIHFNFTNGFRVDYTEWMKGNRIVVNGNKSHWVHSAAPSNTYKDFWNYMETIFMYAGSLSLAKELIPVHLDDMKPGDIFIQGGSPGHAIIVVDMAIDTKTKKKLFLLAQSYMPAQEIQILKNPKNDSISPWYSTDFHNYLVTPEWSFTKTELKRFKQ